MRLIIGEEASLKKNRTLLTSLLWILISISLAGAQIPEEEMPPTISINAGVGLEYFSRTISWDESSSSKLSSCYLTFNAEFGIMKGFLLNAIFGFSSSDFEGLRFRELPFSLEYGEETKSTGGLLFGGEIKKEIGRSEELKLDGLGQLFYCFGAKKEWEIPDLAVPGSAQGRPTWIKASVGPVFTYTRFDSFMPYLHLSLNKIWGTFSIDQTIGDLEGDESQRITSKGFFCLSPGLIYKFNKDLSLKGEVSFIPLKNETNAGFVLRALYSF